MMERLERWLFALLKNRKKRWLVVILTALAFVVSVLMISEKIVLAKMLPGKNANTFDIYIDLPEFASIDETRAVAECVIGKIRSDSRIKDIELFLGQGSPLSLGGLVKGSGMKQTQNVAEIVVNLVAKEERDMPSFALVSQWRPKIQQGCQTTENGANIKMIEPPAGPPVLASVVAEIYGGKSLESRHALAQQVAGVLRDTDGLVDVDVEVSEPHVRYELVPNTVKISLSGLNLKQVNEILYMAFEGMNIAYDNEADSIRQVPIHLVLSDETRKLKTGTKQQLKAKLSELTLMNSKGRLVPLSEVVEVHERSNHPMVMSKNLQEMINVTAETDGVSQLYPLVEAKSTITEQMGERFDVVDDGLFDLHLVDKQSGERFFLHWDGEMQVSIDTFIDLGGAFIAALVLIYFLIVIYYKSYALAGIVLLSSFLSFIGVVVAHWLFDVFTPHTFFLTATSLIGFIALIGISSRNSLLLIDFSQALILEHKMEKNRAIAVATATRAKPIALTAMAIILASTLLATDPIFGGLGVALIGGTVAAVLVSLVFVPVLMHGATLVREQKSGEN